MTFETIIAQETKYKVIPRDQSNIDKSLVSFITSLKEVCLKKDTSMLFEMLDTGIVTSYGAGLFGKKDFKEKWKLQNPENSDLWDRFMFVINLGGVFDTINEKKFFIFPYALSFDWDLDSELDSTQKLSSPFNVFICIDKNIPVYEKPDTNSKVLNFLSYDIIVKDFDISQKQNEKDNYQINWNYILTLDKKIKGWILGESIYSSTGLEIQLEKQKGKWKITCFCSYD